MFGRKANPAIKQYFFFSEKQSEKVFFLSKNRFSRPGGLLLPGSGAIFLPESEKAMQSGETTGKDGKRMKVIIVGGVAAGAGAAARLRRLSEDCEILLLEKGDFISYANCGLPYHLGGVIADRENLLVMPPARFAAWLNVDVRLRHEVTAIDPAKKVVTIRTPEGMREESYDKLLLATGAEPRSGAPHGEGRVLHLWTMADMDRIAAKLAGARRAVIVGGGFIGLETAENLRHRGLAVTLLQRSNHVLPTFDAEMAQPLAAELRSLGVDLRFGAAVAAYDESPDEVKVKLADGSAVAADVVVECIGVQPASQLARAAGLRCGERGHIAVDEYLQTSNPDIYAAGDAVEVTDPVFGGPIAIPLAGPANKQGRIAAANMLGGKVPYRGSLGASVVRVGSLTAAGVGWTEARLKAAGKPYTKIYLHPASSASYYPGSGRLSMKLMFGADGAIYGAQIVGPAGVDKRIDTIAQAMRARRTAPELGELELAYAPPYSSAKDPVNFAGFIAENVLSGLSDVVYPDTIPADAQVLDVREPEEHELGAIPGALNIPLGELRRRLGELDRGRLIVTCCQVGLRGYLAERILKQHGFRAANLSGGWMTWRMFHPEPAAPAEPEPAPESPPMADAPVLDVRGLACPGPVLKLKAALGNAAPGTAVRLLAAGTFEPDLRNWARGAGAEIRHLVREGASLEAEVVKSGGAPAAKAAEGTAEKSAAIVLFSNDFDKAMAALILANGFAAAGMKVSIFFTFWGLTVLRKNPAPKVRKDLVSRMFGWMLPTGARKLALSKMDMMGMGTAMMKRVMKKQSVMSLPELIESARAAGVRFIACEMAMDVMGLRREELIEIDEVAGVASFAALARESGTTLFI